MAVKVAIVDYGTCNISSVYNRIEQHGGQAIVATGPKDLRQADKLILPGVGHFNYAIEKLTSQHLIEALHEEVVVRKKMILGICLGMQLMAEGSDEGGGAAKGLGWINGHVKMLETSGDKRYKIPHIGWNQVGICKTSPLMQGIEPQAEFYFTHSYHFDVADQRDVLNTTEYKASFVSAIEKEHVFGVQYHPEKSYAPGSLVLKNFAAL